MFSRYIDSWNGHFPCFLCQRHRTVLICILLSQFNATTFYSCVEKQKLNQHTKAISVCLFNILQLYNKWNFWHFKDHTLKVELQDLCYFSAFCLQYFLKIATPKNIFHWYERKFPNPDRFPISFHCRLECQKVYWFQTLVGVGLC